MWLLPYHFFLGKFWPCHRWINSYRFLFQELQPFSYEFQPPVCLNIEKSHRHPLRHSTQYETKSYIKILILFLLESIQVTSSTCNVWALKERKFCRKLPGRTHRPQALTENTYNKMMGGFLVASYSIPIEKPKKNTSYDLTCFFEFFLLHG